MQIDSSKRNTLQKINSTDFTVKGTFVLRFLQSKLQFINDKLAVQLNRSIVSSSASRIKSIDSIKQKLRKKGYEETYEMAVEKISDLLGVRAVYFYRDDLYRVAEDLTSIPEINVLQVKDYIKQPKQSGYQSLHLIVQVLVYYQGSVEWVKAEIQLRTVTMDFWANLDHKFRYKCRNSKKEDFDGFMINKSFYKTMMRDTLINKSEIEEAFTNETFYEKLIDNSLIKKIFTYNIQGNDSLTFDTVGDKLSILEIGDIQTDYEQLNEEVFIKYALVLENIDNYFMRRRDDR